MRPTSVSVIGAGVSAWLPINYLQLAFGVAVGVGLTEDAVGVNYSVQHTFQSLGNEAYLPVAITRAGAVATAVFAEPHGLVAGDSLIVVGSGSSELDSQPDSQGRPISWPVASTPTPTSLTYAVTNAGPAAGGPGAVACLNRVFPHASLVNQTVRADGNYAFPITAVRLSVNAASAGGAFMDVLQGMGR